MSDALLLDHQQREAVWNYIAQTVEAFVTDVEKHRVAPILDVAEVRSYVEKLDFEQPIDPVTLAQYAVEGLAQYGVHTPHPRYFGLFNPAPTTMGILADTLVAAFNPQLAAWSHSPFAAECERHLIRAFGAQFGYGMESVDGTFTAGGAEANHTALLTALVYRFGEFAADGVRAIAGRPVFYVSAQSHHSFVKGARFCGLGHHAVRQIPTDAHFRMDVNSLKQQILEDIEAGDVPFMVVATAGTTSAGIIEPLQEIADVAEAHGLWLHVDAAWGGLAVMVPELRPLLQGIERADSITFDAHKGLSVPMSAGLYLTRHPHLLAETCRVTADYMPHDADGLDVVDPFVHSMQWSRRFIGLKVLLSLGVAGWDGYAGMLRHQVKMGNVLRKRLGDHDWLIVNETPLPVVCFTDGSGKITAGGSDAIASAVVKSGSAWISTTRLDEQTFVLRACITNFRSTEHDIDVLIAALDHARDTYTSPRDNQLEEL